MDDRSFDARARNSPIAKPSGGQMKAAQTVLITKVTERDVEPGRRRRNRASPVQAHP